MPDQPVVKVLSAAGLGSRRKMADAIKRGSVTVNGRVIDSFIEPVDPDRDDVAVDGKRVSLRGQRFVYVIMNKPRGVVSTTSDTHGGKTVIDILPPKYRSVRLYPVGRLDKDSTGLILLTNDGDLTYRLTHPRFEEQKVYLVHISGELSREDVAKLESGVDLDDGRTSPAAVRKTAQSRYSVTIHEGKKHEVRRMFAALGYTVLDLKRVRLGNLRLGTLGEGEVRELSAAEVRILRQGRSP